MPFAIGNPFSTVPAGPSHGFLRKAVVRQTIFGAAFAILVSPDSFLVLCFGLTGSSGNSGFTAGVLITTTLAVGLLCFRRHVVLLPADYLFLALVLCIVSSSAFNGWTSSAKQYALFVLSLAAYPACRFVSSSDISSGRPSFIWSASIILLLGSIATAIALWQQWYDPHGKPFVFGFEAEVYFAGLLSFLVVALVTSGDLTVRRTALIASLIFLPAAVFAASMTRFIFIALVASLGVATIVAEVKQRKYIVVVGLLILLAIVAGLIARSDKTRIFADYALEDSTGEVGSEKPPSCYLQVNPNNSIAIRKALVRDAVFLVPGAGWVGTGLDSFMRFSCIELTEVHNSVLQAAVEFGWLGGSLLLFIIVVAVSSLWPLASRDAAARFVLCGLVLIVFLSLGYGIINHDAVLFAFLGCAIGLRQTARIPASSAVLPEYA
jgi:hypothetical protein